MAKKLVKYLDAIVQPRRDRIMSAPLPKKIRVTQIGSPIGRTKDQRATLIGLGLNKVGRSRTLDDTQSIRGMTEKVAHLVRVDKPEKDK